jgi:ribose transport system substrate-binding protein
MTIDRRFSRYIRMTGELGGVRSFQWTLILLLIIGLVVGGCDSKSGTPEPQKRRDVVIGILLCMTEDTPFFISLVKGAREAAERLNAKVVVKYAHDDVESQRRHIRSLVDERVSALLINPVSDAVVPEMEAAAAAGVPVFTIDRSAPSDATVSHIASDNHAGGRMAGEYLAEALHRKGKVVEIEGTLGSSAARNRGAGFHQAIEAFPEIEVVARETANFNKPAGKSVFARILAEHPKIDGVFAHNDDMILGAIEAAKEAGRAKRIKFVGFDAIEDAIAALERGDLLATIAQRPAEMGRLGVELAIKYLNGESVPKSMPVDLSLIIR